MVTSMIGAVVHVVGLSLDNSQKTSNKDPSVRPRMAVTIVSQFIYIH